MEIILKLTIEQTNIVLGALSKQPYEAVFMVINEIKKQASEQHQFQKIDKI